MKPFTWFVAAMTVAAIAALAAGAQPVHADTPVTRTEGASRPRCTTPTVPKKPLPPATQPPATPSPLASNNTSVAVAVACVDPLAQAAPAASTASDQAKPEQPSAKTPAETKEAEGFTAAVRAVSLAAVAVLGLALGFASIHQARDAAAKADKEPFRIVSYWGGFGGSGTGWQLTPAAVSLLASAILALAALGVVAFLLHATRAPETAPAPAPTKNTTAK